MASGFAPRRLSASRVDPGMNGAIITQTMRSASSTSHRMRDSAGSAPVCLNLFHGSRVTM
jgi:hypothetical protein